MFIQTVCFVCLAFLQKGINLWYFAWAASERLCFFCCSVQCRLGKKLHRDMAQKMWLYKATLLEQTSPRHWHKNRPFWQHTFDDVPWSLHGLSIGVALLPLDKKNHSPLDFCNLRIVEGGGGWGCRWWRCCWNKSMPSFTVNSSDKCYQQKCSHFSSGSSCLSTLKIT